MTQPPAPDAMPTTRGVNFFLADPNLQHVCAGVMAPDDFARARPHLVAMGETAGGQLDELAAIADQHPPTLRTHDATGRRVDEIVRHPAYAAMERIALYLKKWLRPPAPPASVFTARECDHLPALIDWTPVAVEGLAPDGSC